MEEPIADPAMMTPQQRRQEIAAILARGVLRLRRVAQTSTGSRSSRTSENSSEQRHNGLDEGQKRALMCPLDSHEQGMKGARIT